MVDGCNVMVQPKWSSLASSNSHQIVVEVPLAVCPVLTASGEQHTVANCCDTGVQSSMCDRVVHSNGGIIQVHFSTSSFDGVECSQSDGSF